LIRQGKWFENKVFIVVRFSTYVIKRTPLPLAGREIAFKVSLGKYSIDDRKFGGAASGIDNEPSLRKENFLCDRTRLDGV